MTARAKPQQPWAWLCGRWAAGRRVVIVQFLKGGATGELEPLQTLGATFYRGKAGQKFVFQMNEEEKAATRALQTENLRRALAEPADLLILDEACAAPGI